MFFKSKKIRATMRERMHGPGIDKQIVLFTRIKVPRKRRRQNQKRIRENAPKMFRFVSMVNQIESFTLVFKIRVIGNEIGKSSYKLRYYYFVKDLVMNSLFFCSSQGILLNTAYADIHLNFNIYSVYYPLQRLENMYEVHDHKLVQGKSM